MKERFPTICEGACVEGYLAAEDGVCSLPTDWSLIVATLGGPLNVELYVLATLGVGDGGGDDDLRSSWKCFLKALCFVDDKVLGIVVVGDDGVEDELAKLPSANSIQSQRFFKNSSQVADSMVPASPNSWLSSLLEHSILMVLICCKSRLRYMVSSCIFSFK